ncbi:10769_t:CDS:2, partial [Rhizophagus irregularis]
NDEEKVLQVAGYRLPPIFFTSANKFPYSERTLAIPPDVLYCQSNDKYYTQDEIAEYLKNSDHLINKLHALYIRVRNLDNNKAMLQDFVKIMLPSIAEYIHIIDKLVVHVRKLFIDWRNKLWITLLNKYKELGNRKLSAIQIANMMSVEDIRKIWKQWCCNIDEAALEAAMESLRDVCAMGFRAIDVEESLNKAHDRFLCLYNDLFTVNLSITTRYNIATSMDLLVYYFEEFKRKSSKKNSLF